VLSVTIRLRLLPSREIVTAEQVNQTGVSKTRCPIRTTFFIDEKWESNSCYFPKVLSIMNISKANRSQCTSLISDL